MWQRGHRAGALARRRSWLPVPVMLPHGLGEEVRKCVGIAGDMIWSETSSKSAPADESVLLITGLVTRQKDISRRGSAKALLSLWAVGGVTLGAACPSPALGCRP